MPATIQPGMHTGSIDGGESVKITGWDGANDNSFTIWKASGDLVVNGVQKLSDGTLVVTSGLESIHNDGSSWRPVNDENGDGYVLKISPQGTDGKFGFELDRAYGSTVTGKFG
ncbi:MAG: hypothetical protein R3E95_15695 [Thiolinea sp.]